MVKNRILLYLLITSIACSSALAQEYDPAQWDFEVRELSDEEVELQFQLALRDGWRIYSQHSDQNGPTPMRFFFSENTSYTLLGNVVEPKAEKDYQVVCFLDACFSGATREDDMLLTGRGVAIKPKEETPQGNLIVFTSASGNETAHQYEEKQHGLFTYYLLKKMQDSKGTFTLGEMYDYVSKNVKKTSFDVNNKIQTPSVIPSETMGTKWRNIKL